MPTATTAELPNGFRMVLTPELAGAKAAVRIGRTLYVSPAMYDLLANPDNPDQLIWLMHRINVVTYRDAAEWRRATAAAAKAQPAAG